MKRILKIISYTLVVAFTLTTVLPPSFAGELISPTSRFEVTGDTSEIGFGTHLRLVLKTSPASLTPLWMRGIATAVIALFLVSCTGNSSQPPGSSSSVTHIQISISNDADLIKALKNPSPEVVMRAIDFAGETKALFAIPLLIEIASNPHAPVAQGPTVIYDGRTARVKIPLRSRAIGALTKMGAENKEGVSALCGLGINEDRAIGLSAIQALIDLKVFDKASELLCGYLSDTTIQADFRTIAAMRLADVVRETKDKTAAPAILRAYLLEQNSSVRDMIDMVLDVMQPISLGQLARDILRDDSDARARKKAAEFLGQLKDASALGDLQNASQNDLDAQVKQAADEAIQKIKPAQQQKQSSLAPFKLMPAAILLALIFPEAAYGADGGVLKLVTDYWIISGITGLIVVAIIIKRIHHYTVETFTVKPALESFSQTLTSLKNAKDNRELILQLENLEKLAISYAKAQIFSTRGTGITPQNLKPIKEEATTGASKDKVLGMLKAIEFGPVNTKAKGIIDIILKDVTPLPKAPQVVPIVASKVALPAATIAPAVDPAERFIGILRKPAAATPQPAPVAPVQAATTPAKPMAVFVANATGLNPNDYIITNGMGFLRQPILSAKGSWKQRSFLQLQKKPKIKIKISDLLTVIFGYGFGLLMLFMGGGAIYTGELIPPPYFPQPIPGTGYYSFIYMLDVLLAVMGLAIVVGAPLLGGLVNVLDKILGRFESPAHLTKNFIKIDNKSIPEDKEEKLTKQLDQKKKILRNLIGLAYANYSFPSLTPFEQQSILSLLEERTSHQKTKIHSLMITLLGIIAADVTETEPESAPLRQFTGKLDKLLRAPVFEWSHFKDLKNPTQEDMRKKHCSAFALLAISLTKKDEVLETLKSRIYLNEPTLEIDELYRRLIEDVKLLIQDKDELFQVRHVAAIVLGEAVETEGVDFEAAEDTLVSLGYMWLEAQEKHYDTEMLRFAIRALVEASEREPAAVEAAATQTHATSHQGAVSITEQLGPLAPKIPQSIPSLPRAIPMGQSPAPKPARGSS